MINVSRHQLPNGLKIVHSYDGATAMVAVNLLYGVGARNESPDLTGMAHLFEHLMFGGSANIPDFDANIELAGGKNNAWTSNDFTNFYDIIPAQNVETAFWLESDRMMALAFSDKALEVQRSVVIEEFKQQCLNRPYGDESHYLRRAAYSAHPYQWPVIGKEIGHIEKVTQDDVRDFFYRHYGPDNAILSVAGNITFEETIRLAEKWFGPIPSIGFKKPALPAEPEQIAPKICEATGRVPATDIIVAYKMEGYGTEQYFAADLITDLLANGQSSRFYRNLLVATDIFSAVDASIVGSEDPGLLLVHARLAEEGAEAEARAMEAMHDEIKRLTECHVSEHELARALNRMESAQMFENLSYMAKAQNLALAEYHSEDINARMDIYRALTPEAIADHASRIFRPENATTLFYRPQ